MPEPLQHAKIVAERFGISERALYEMCKRGRGPRAIRVTKGLRFRPEDVEAWLEDNAKVGAA